MNKLIRNSLSIFLMLVLLIGGSVGVMGVCSASIKLDNTEARPGQEVTVPVYIENNPGLCGTKITVSYDKSLQVVSVKKGAVLSSGNFVQNADAVLDNSFDVVWNSSVENKANGVLFVVIFKLPDNAPGDYSIKITYDKDNTFNSKYDDVTLDCGSAVISVPNKDDGTDEKPTVWEKIVNFFKKVIAFIGGLFK